MDDLLEFGGYCALRLTQPGSRHVLELFVPGALPQLLELLLLVMHHVFEFGGFGFRLPGGRELDVLLIAFFDLQR